MAHEILERNQGAADLLIIGMQTGGVALSSRIAEAIAEIESSVVPTGTLDATMHRDDLGLRPIALQAPTEIPCDPTDKVVVLVDDVLALANVEQVLDVSLVNTVPSAMDA